jgi:hypothetical protein
MLTLLSEGLPVSIAVTLIDGLVLARSAFNHSVNYRSVVIFGRAREVTDAQEKWRALEALVDHVLAGRWRDVRQPTAQELKATTVVSVGLDHASAKVRHGPPKDSESDLGFPVWAGVVPLTLAPGSPVPDPHLAPGTLPSDTLTDWVTGVGRRSRAGGAGEP